MRSNLSPPSGLALFFVLTVSLTALPANAQTGRVLTVSSSRSLAEPWPTSISSHDRSVEDGYLTRLQLNVDCDFRDTKLTELAEYFQRQTGVPFLLDHRALEEASVGEDTTVTFRAQRIPARSALRLILGQMSLTLVAKANVVLITTVDQANSELEIRVYWVADLVETFRSADGVVQQDFDSLIELITTTIAPTTWDEVGGPGAIHEFRPKSALVFSQTAEVHEQVAELLETLRRLPNAQSRQVISGIRRLPEARSTSASSESSPGSWPAPIVNVQRVTPSNTRNGGFFSVDHRSLQNRAAADPVQAAHVDTANRATNAPQPSWRIPRIHRD